DLTNGFLFPRDDGLTPNDSKGHGAPNDPNNFQNFPALLSVGVDNGQTHISGTLKAAPGSTFRVEFFASDTDPLGLPAEGQEFLGFVNATTAVSGNASFSTTVNVAVAVGRIITATATDGIGNTSEFSAGVKVLPPLALAVGVDTGSAPEVKVLDTTGAVRFDFFAYSPGFTGGVRVALADINGDGILDIITGAGPGGAPHVKVFSGMDLSVLRSFYAYDAGFSGGVYVAAGDINGDGRADIITGAGAGGMPHVEAFSGMDGSVLRSFFAYDAGFSGGV